MIIFKGTLWQEPGIYQVQIRRPMSMFSTVKYLKYTVQFFTIYVRKEFLQKRTVPLSTDNSPWPGVWSGGTKVGYPRHFITSTR